MRRFAGSWLVAAFVCLLPPSASAAAAPQGPQSQSLQAQSEQAAGGASSLPSGETRSAPEAEALPKRFVDWLVEVAAIMSPDERRLFLTLAKDYQRDAFIRQFWRVRDPYPKTGRNEFRERWDERVGYARSHFGSLSDDRARILLVHGFPDRVVEVRCSTTRKPAEIWLYLGSDQVDFRFLLVFLRRAGVGPGRIWRPGMSGSLDLVADQAAGCINGYLLRDVERQVLSATVNGMDYDVILSRVLARPRPRSEEWVATFASFSTDLPEDADVFSAQVSIDYLGRHSQRTVMQTLVRVPKDQATLGDHGGYRSYNYNLTGEVILQGQLFESFRYKYGMADTDLERETQIPLAFQRYLRPGAYTLILKLEDLNSGRFFRHVEALEVPKLAEQVAVLPAVDEESARLFREATESVALGETDIKVIPPARDLQTGFVRVDTIVTGEEVDSVVFYLDERLILRKNRPPYNVEIDLGPFPKLHRLRVEALDETGTPVASDEALLNAGSHRFSVRLIEPRRQQRYASSLRARAEVEVPEGSTLDRVELFLNEELVATLYQPPWVQPMLLPSGRQVAYVRAVAHLTDGNTSEDLVFINGPDLVEEVDIQFVQLYASVFDREGRPMGGLRSEDFTVIEDGRPQTVARFERVENLPIHVCVLIDNSASMHGALDTTRQAALTFFEQAIHPRDRASVITFNRFPSLAVKLTNDLRYLGGGLAGLSAEGQTALYDSLMFSLYYFAGITGQRAILLLSDGKDEVSKFSFDETLEYARRAGVTVYSIGLGINDGAARRNLAAIANETGGAAFFIDDVADLHSIYQGIERELRSQYLVAYQSSNTSTDDRFRRVELKVDRPGSVVKTVSGYYP